MAFDKRLLQKGMKSSEKRVTLWKPSEHWYYLEHLLSEPGQLAEDAHGSLLIIRD